MVVCFLLQVLFLISITKRGKQKIVPIHHIFKNIFKMNSKIYNSPVRIIFINPSMLLVSILVLQWLIIIDDLSPTEKKNIYIEKKGSKHSTV